MAKCLYYMGCIKLKQNKFEESLEHFEDAIKLRSDDDSQYLPNIYT